MSDQPRPQPDDNADTPQAPMPERLSDDELDRAFATEFGTTLPPGDPVRPFLRATETIYRRYLLSMQDLHRQIAADLERYRRQDGPVVWMFAVLVVLQLALLGLYVLRP